MQRSNGKRLASALMSTVFVVSSLMTVLPAYAAAAGEEKLLCTDDGFTYIVNDDDTVTIKGYKSEEENGRFAGEFLNLPDTIDGKTVTAIDSGTQFRDLGFTEIHLPAQVETISDWAFAGNDGLKEVTIPATVKTAERPFTYAASLEKVVFEDGITELPESILSCTDFTSVTVPDSVTKINRSAFDGNSKLEEVHIPDSVTYIDGRAFTGCTALKILDLPDSLDYIGYYAFAETTSLESVTIPAAWNFQPDGNDFFALSGVKEVTFENGRTTIPPDIFPGCEKLETINYPEGVTKIGSGAFKNCPSLKNPKLPGTVEEIESFAFQNCSGIEHLDLPSSLTTIGVNAFFGLTGLKYLYVPHDINNSPDLNGTTVFYGSGIEKLVFADGVTRLNAMTGGLQDLVDITIPESVTAIYNQAFDNDQKLEYLKLPDGLTDLTGGSIFRNCNSLRQLVIPKDTDTHGGWEFQHTPALEVVYFQDGMEKIPNNMFTECESLKEIHIPESVTEIGDYAFSGCENLEEIVMTQESIKTNYCSFNYCDRLWDDRVSLCRRGELFVNKKNIPTEDGGSLSNYTVYYAINPIYHAGFKQSRIVVTTAEQNCIVGESIGDLDAVHNGYGFTYDISETDGVLRFSVRNPAGSEVETKVEFWAVVTSFPGFECRHVIVSNDKYSGMTINTPETAGRNGSNPKFSVYGYAPYGQDVTILLNGKEYKTVTANKYSGKYSLQAEYEGPEDRITVQAVCGDVKSDVKTVEIDDTLPVLVDFDVSHHAHDRWTVDMTDMFTTGYTPYVPLNPGNPLEFDVEMDNTDNVAKVLVVSEVNGRTSYVGLDKDSETGRYKGEGFFETPVPGKITVRTVPKNKKDELTVTKDGDGAIESITNKAGKELLKDDPTAPEDPAEKFVERTEQTVVETGNGNLAVTFRKKPKTDTGSAPYLPPEEDDEEDFEIRVFEGKADSIDIGGKTVKPIDIVEDHKDYSFERSNTTVIDENGDEHEYYVRIVTKEDSDFAQSFTKSIPLTSDSSDTRTVNDFLTDKDLTRVIEGIVITDLNKKLGTAEFITVSYTGDKETDSLINDLTVGAGTSYILEKAVLSQGLKDAAGVLGVGITAAQETANLYDHYFSHSYRSVRVDYSNDPFVQEYATELKVTSAALFIGRAAIAAVAVKGAAILAVAGLSLWPGILAGAALTFGVWAVGQLYNKLEKGLDELTDGATPEGEMNVGLDPSGIAYEWLLSNPVKGVTAEIYYQDDDGNAIKWNAEDYDQENPQITDSAGWFAWDVPEGMWQVRLSGEGYEDAQSEWVPVLPVQTEVNVGLTSKLPAEIADAGFGGGKVMVKFTKHMLDSTLTTDSIVLQDKSGKAVDFDIAPVKEEGNNTAASMTFILTPKNELSLDGAKIGVKTGAQSYAGVACKDSGMTALRELAEGELPQPASAANLGDVNEDGFVDSGDASLILSEYALLSTGADSSFTDVQRSAADVNSDGIIDSSDASSILAYYAMASTATGEVPSMAEYMAENAA